MSTAPTEAHRKLACEILMEHSVSGAATKDGVIAAAQLIRDSEARAVEAANKRLGAQMNYVVALQRAIEYHAQGLEIPAAIGSDCPHHASMLNAALTAARERVRVLREAAEIMLVPHIENSEGGTPSGTYAMTFRYEQLAAALAFTAEHAKEGSK